MMGLGGEMSLPILICPLVKEEENIMMVITGLRNSSPFQMCLMHFKGLTGEQGLIACLPLPHRLCEFLNFLLILLSPIFHFNLKP